MLGSTLARDQVGGESPSGANLPSSKADLEPIPAQSRLHRIIAYPSSPAKHPESRSSPPSPPHGEADQQAHPVEEEKKGRPCNRFFGLGGSEEGFCYFGSGCRFSHDIATVRVCNKWEVGRCILGRSCSFLHGQIVGDKIIKSNTSSPEEAQEDVGRP